MSAGLTLAYYIGQSHVVAGTTTDMVAYIDNGVFIQLWIGAEDKLPRMVRAIFLDDPERLRGEVEFSNWQLDSTVPADTFVLSDTANAKRIPFAHLQAEPNPGNTAPGAPPSKAKQVQP